MIIAVTDTITSEDKFNHYTSWLVSAGSNLKWMKLSHRLDNLNGIENCSGLILTGGSDVSPALYSGPINHPKIKDVDIDRDNFERQLFDKAISLNIPVLGICRGMQLVNVHLGGTLIPDIEEAGFRSHLTKGEFQNRHKVFVENGSILQKIIGAKEGEINSSHHQAVDKPGIDLKVVARSDDGIIEGMEFENRNNDSFFHLVQWHPERMVKEGSLFSENILKEFLNQASNYFS
jgi:putative glutamine amidotransferase